MLLALLLEVLLLVQLQHLFNQQFICSLICFLCSSAKRALPYVPVGLAAGTAAVVAAPLVLGAVGFTAGGVAAGSIAAFIQSTVYGGSVASGSAFALAQSAGATGIGVAGNVAIGGITAGITGGLTALGNYVFVCFNYKSCSICLVFGTRFINFLINYSIIRESSFHKFGHNNIVTEHNCILCM